MSAKTHGEKAKTVREFTIEDFLQRSSASVVSLETYRRQLSQIATWNGGPLASMSERQLIALKVRFRGMLSGWQYLALLKHFLKKSGREDLVPLCVMKQKKRKLEPGEILSVKEMEGILDSSKSLRDRAMFAFLWEAGCRVSEMISVRLKHVRELPKTEGNGTHYVVWLAKSKTEERENFIMEGAKLLERWLAVHPGLKAKDPEAHLFPAYSGGPMHRTVVLLSLKAAAKRAGIEKRVFNHLIRHSRCTHLLRLGVPEGQIRRLLGWRPGSPMIARYGHLVGRDDYKALLRAQGHVVPEEEEMQRIAYDSESLKTLAPMLVPPAASPAERAERERDVEIVGMLHELLAKPDVRRVLLKALSAPQGSPSRGVGE